jgi:hypothetical protein
MKKVLLTLAVALVGLTAGATGTAEFKSGLKKAYAQQLVKGQPEMMIQTATAMPKQAKRVAKAEQAEGDTLAVFIYMSPGEEVPNFVNAMELVAISANKDITVNYEDEQGNPQTEVVHCNVMFPSFCGFNFDIYAYYYYDEEYECNAYIIPEQEVMVREGQFTAGEYEGQDYEFHYDIIGIDEPNAQGSYNIYGNVMLLEDPDDGTLSFDNCDGWGLLVQDAKHEGYGGIALAVFDCEFNKPNAKVFYSYTYTTKDEQGEEVTKWREIEGANAYVEDYGSAVVLNGFYGTKLNMRFDEEGLVHMPLGQPLVDQNLDDEDFAYGYIHTVGVSPVLDENGNNTGTIKTDFEKTENIGTCPAPYAIEFDCYMRALSNLTSEGMGYGGPFFYGPTIVLNDTNFAAGISDATKAPVNILQTKTYNLMGQQVSRGHKGIVIHNGHKYLNK